MKILIEKTSFNLIVFVLVVLIFIGCQNAKSEKTEEKQPNFIIIMADDLGYNDLSCFGSHYIETPHLDQLASDGVKATQFYAASAVCTPSRASLLSGNYPLRYDIRQYFPRKEFLTEEALLIPEMLKQKGYYCAHVGKWHLGGLHKSFIENRNRGEDAIPGPLQQGFDHYLSMYSTDGADLLGKRRLFHDGGKYLASDDIIQDTSDSFMTKILTDEALRIINQSNEIDQPFYVNLWYHAPHTPYEPAPEPHYSKYKNLNYPERPDQNFHRGHNQPGDAVLYNSMVSYMDEMIGRITDELKRLNLYENTFIIFTSDNGPSYRGRPDPFTGSKADLHEGGIRVPFIAVWPNKIPKNKVLDGVIHMNDIFPTFCDAAGISPDKYKVDGISALPYLTKGKQDASDRTLFWQLDLAVDPWGEVWYPQPGKKPEPYSTSIVRKGSWKLLADSTQPVILYNLEDDSLESVNLINEYPEKVAEMTSELKAYFKEERMQYRTAIKPK